jgi:hypothetical protein
MTTILDNVPKVGRLERKPQHRFYTESKPWEITPVAIAPVLPGETMKNLLLQSRVVSAPLVSSVVGWWLEYFVFYVNHRQLPSATSLVSMVLDPSVTLTPTAVDTTTYYDGRGFNFVKESLTTIVNEWFREQGEAYATGVTAGRGGRPLAKIGFEDFAESLVDTTVLADGGALGGTQESQDKALELYQYLRAVNMTRMTYEEWLATYGVNLQRAEKRDRPELIRYVRDWTYPTNTVEPTTGVPTAAASWGVAERADKDRFFDEPGFIFVCQVLRPKIYFGNQTGHGASMLDRVMRWLPAIMSDDPSSSLAEFTSAQGPFGKAAAGFTNGYWLDVRDLFMYGDQYMDGTAQANSLALPSIAQVRRFATEAMGDALFSTATKTVRADGVVSLNILGTQQDYT